MWHPNADPLPMLRYVVCAIDATLWSGDVIMEAVKMLNTIVSMGSGNVGYIQLPISHSAVKLAHAHLQSGVSPSRIRQTC